MQLKATLYDEHKAICVMCRLIKITLSTQTSVNHACVNRCAIWVRKTFPATIDTHKDTSGWQLQVLETKCFHSQFNIKGRNGNLLLLVAEALFLTSHAVDVNLPAHPYVG